MIRDLGTRHSPRIKYRRGGKSTDVVVGRHVGHGALGRPGDLNDGEMMMITEKADLIRRRRTREGLPVPAPGREAVTDLAAGRIYR